MQIQKSWIAHDPLNEQLKEILSAIRSQIFHFLFNFVPFHIFLKECMYKEKCHLSLFPFFEISNKVTLLYWKCTFWPISTALCVAVLFILLNARTTTIIVTYDLTESSPRDHTGSKRFKIYVLVNFSAKDSESKFLYTRKMQGCMTSIALIFFELTALDQHSQLNELLLSDQSNAKGHEHSVIVRDPLWGQFLKQCILDS